MKYYYKLIIDDAENLYQTEVPKCRWTPETKTVCIKCENIPRFAGRKETVELLTRCTYTKSDFKRVPKSDIFLEAI